MPRAPRAIDPVVKPPRLARLRRVALWLFGMIAAAWLAFIVWERVVFDREE